MHGKDLLCKLNKRYYQLLDELQKVDDSGDKRILADIPNGVDITKKQAAIIVHEFLRLVLHEEDEKDVSKAKELKDLYDCRVCVKHIEQVYVKGIIDAMINSDKAAESGLPIIFGGNELLSDEEADQIVERVVNKQTRHHISTNDIM